MIKYTLLIFLFANLDTYTGNFHTLKQKFPTYEHCVEYVEKNRLDSPDYMGQIFIPTNQIIGLTWCRPVDIEE